MEGLLGGSSWLGLECLFEKIFEKPGNFDLYQVCDFIVESLLHVLHFLQ